MYTESFTKKYNTSNMVDLLNEIDKCNYKANRIDVSRIKQKLNASNYPPYNVVKHDSNNYSVEIALAGFRRDEIEVSTEQNILKIASTFEAQDPDREYLHRGLSKRSFSTTWQLAEEVRVASVTYENGLLIISLEKIVSDHQKKIIYNISMSPWVGAGKQELLLEDK